MFIPCPWLAIVQRVVSIQRLAGVWTDRMKHPLSMQVQGRIVDSFIFEYNGRGSKPIPLDSNLYVQQSRPDSPDGLGLKLAEKDFEGRIRVAQLLELLARTQRSLLRLGRFLVGRGVHDKLNVFDRRLERRRQML